MTKVEHALGFYKDGRLKESLKLLSTFRLNLTKEESSTIKRGYECFNNPSFYQSLGRNPQECIEQAEAVAQDFFKKYEQAKIKIN